MPPKKRQRTSDTTSSSSSSSSSSGESSGTVSLNVGGKVYTTTRSTLENAPFFDGLFRAVSSGATTTKDEDGRFFVDRDSEFFKIILQFLRSGVPVMASTEQELETLRAEFEFFGLDKEDVIDRTPKQKVKQIVRIDIMKAGNGATLLIVIGTEASIKGLFDDATFALFVEHAELFLCTKNDNLNGEAVWNVVVTLSPIEVGDQNDAIRQSVAQDIFGARVQNSFFAADLIEMCMGSLDVRAASRGFAKENDTSRAVSVTYVRTVEVRVAQEDEDE
jgi:hypothetical protein